MSQAPAEGQGQQTGNGPQQGQQNGAPPQFPAGVQPGSAAAQAHLAAQGQQTGNGAADDAGRAGGPDALRADLAKERQQRHALEQQLKTTNEALEQLKAGLGQALGVQPAATPEQLQQQAQQVQAQQQTAMTQLAVYQLSPGAGADPVKLMDSASFLNSIKDLQPTDHAGITAAIKAAVERNKSLAPSHVGAGANDAGAGGSGGSQKPSMTDLIRAGAGFGGR